MPDSVIIGVATAVAIVALLVVISITYCLLKRRSRKKSHKNILRSTEEVSERAAPPISSSSSSSLRSTIVPVDGQRLVTSLVPNNTLDGQLRGIDGKLDELHAKVEGVSTGLTAMSKYTVKFFKVKLSLYRYTTK